MLISVTSLTVNTKYDILNNVNAEAEITFRAERKMSAFHQSIMEGERRSGLCQKAIAERDGMVQPNISRIGRGGAVSFNAFSEHLATSNIVS